MQNIIGRSKSGHKILVAQILWNVLQNLCGWFYEISFGKYKPFYKTFVDDFY